MEKETSRRNAPRLACCREVESETLVVDIHRSQSKEAYFAAAETGAVRLGLRD